MGQFCAGTVEGTPQAGAEGEVRGEPMDYASVMEQVRLSPAKWFGLETPDDKDIWCYIIAASGHLEDWAAYFLWEYDGRPCEIEQYRRRENLGSLHARLETLNVLVPYVLQTLKEVNELRNAVAHRHGTYGVTEPETPQGRPMGIYRNAQVFRQQWALEALVEDVSDAASALIVAAHPLRKKNEASTRGDATMSDVWKQCSNAGCGNQACGGCGNPVGVQAEDTHWHVSGTAYHKACGDRLRAEPKGK